MVEGKYSPHVLYSKRVFEKKTKFNFQVKKDYLEGGAMADTADLIVLGAYFGTGNKGD